MDKSDKKRAAGRLFEPSGLNLDWTGFCRLSEDSLLPAVVDEHQGHT